MNGQGRHPLEFAGRRFGKLVAIERVGTGAKQKSALWSCLCDCGNRVVVSAARLVKTPDRSCGCDRNPAGSTRNAAYRPWHAMITRCTNKRHSSFPEYGGRGVRVCARWLSFAAFLEDMGPRPSLGHSIDRVDPTGHYEPGNCRWATAIEQGRNKRREVFFVVNGVPLHMAEASERLNISPSGVTQRVRRGVLKKFVVVRDIQSRGSMPAAEVGATLGGCGSREVTP